MSVILGTIVIDDHSHNLTRGLFRIGRDPTESDIVIKHQMLSKVHLIIKAEADGVAVIFDYLGLDMYNTNVVPERHFWSLGLVPDSNFWLSGTRYI